MIGRYRLIKLIGEGGFGLVWMAEQVEPMKRLVALKIVKLGMDTKAVLVRFEAERQALAMMEHPNIARVLDGGATNSGRPYFVMELVRGLPITDYCDVNKLPLRIRIELFALVCRAVQHAHKKGIIHRDLKPSNILVAVQDDQPVPKVIDFGVAKALETRLTERTLYTHLNQWVGTPAYMSPEQASLSRRNVDVRSDVYALGVVLYELLSGHTPFGQQKLREEGYEAMLRTIREDDPPEVSTRLCSLPREVLHAVADNRSQTPEKLRRQLNGELDWILLKALKRDRSLRYESATELADELVRFSAGEAISAAPPSFAYRAAKHLRRHGSLVQIVVGVVLMLVVATVAINLDRSREENSRVSYPPPAFGGWSKDSLINTTWVEPDGTNFTLKENNMLRTVRGGKLVVGNTWHFKDASLVEFRWQGGAEGKVVVTLGKDGKSAAFETSAGFRIPLSLVEKQ